MYTNVFIGGDTIFLFKHVPNIAITIHTARIYSYQQPVHPSSTGTPYLVSCQEPTRSVFLI